MGLLIFSISAVILLLILPSQGAPRKPYNTYDQRQDGKFNLHAKLDNFLIVVAPSSSSGNAELAGLLQNDLVAQALDLKNVASRVASHQDDSNDPVIAEAIQQVAGRPSEDKKKTRREDPSEPVEETVITRITTEKLSKENAGSDKGAAGVKLVAIVQRDFPVNLVSSEASKFMAKEDENIKDIGSLGSETEPPKDDASGKTARSLSNRSNESSVSKLPPVDSEAAENKVSGIGSIDRRNDVGPADREPQELKLLGGAIENCGPQRFRDRFGVCRSRSAV